MRAYDECAFPPAFHTLGARNRGPSSNRSKNPQLPVVRWWLVGPPPTVRPISAGPIQSVLAVRINGRLYGYMGFEAAVIGCQLYFMFLIYSNYKYRSNYTQIPNPNLFFFNRDSLGNVKKSTVHPQVKVSPFDKNPGAGCGRLGVGWGVSTCKSLFSQQPAQGTHLSNQHSTVQ